MKSWYARPKFWQYDFTLRVRISPVQSGFCLN